MSVHVELPSVAAYILHIERTR